MGLLFDSCMLHLDVEGRPIKVAGYSFHNVSDRRHEVILDFCTDQAQWQTEAIAPTRLTRSQEAIGMIEFLNHPLQSVRQ